MQQTVYGLPHITNQYWTLLEMFTLFILWHCSVALESETPQACLLLGAVFLFPASPSALWSRLPLRWVTRTGEENMLRLLSSHSWWEPLFKPSWLPAYQEARLFPILCSAWSLWGKTIWSMLALFVSMNWRTGILRGGRGHLWTSCSSLDPCALFLISRSWCSSLVTYSPHWRENDPQHSWGTPRKVKSPISLRNCLLPEKQLT